VNASDLHTPDFRPSLNEIAGILKDKRTFLLATHIDPDADGIGSMLALGLAFIHAEKEVVLFTKEPVPSPINSLKGSDRIVHSRDSTKDFDAVVVLDCADRNRVSGFKDCLEGLKPLINIDHHETNSHFGDLNLVDTGSSSTGELVFHLIKLAGLPISFDVAENLFAAIQTDTGSFRYNNTTPECLNIAAELMSYGVKPWALSRRIMDGYGRSRLRLLEMALGTARFYHEGKVGIMMVTREMFEKARAERVDSERFVDYPRYVLGVEIAALIRQTGENEYKFSMRSNGDVNVARLASRFGGGGHSRAAGFECQGSIEVLKEKFLLEAAQFLDGISQRRNTLD
jgi:phosphoesterase RecJ-like protein